MAVQEFHANVQERLAKQASKRRERSVDDTLYIFKEMQAGSETGLRNCLRFKIDPASDNGTLRDPVAYRCNLTPHLHTGTKYRVIPVSSPQPPAWLPSGNLLLNLAIALSIVDEPEPLSKQPG